MEIIEIGATGLKTTRLGLGLAALGRPGYINLGHAEDLEANYDVNAMQQRTHRVLDAAWDAGIRYYDAARSYGRGEAFLGSWLAARQIAPDAVTVGSKWGYTYTANWQVEAEKHEIKEHSLSVLTRQWGETQAHLRDHLDLYQIHSATQSSGVLDNAPVLDELARLKATGVRIGLSLSGTGQAATLEQALRIKRDGQRLFDTVQITWNLLERSTEQTLQAAHAAGMGVIVKEALANGRLTARNTAPDFAPQMAALKAQAQRLNTTVDALALAAVLAQPWAHIVLSGVATVAHLQSNIAALEVQWDQEAEDALAEIRETPDAYWTTRSGLPWN